MTQIPEMAMVLIAVARVPSTNHHLSPFSWLLYNILSKKKRPKCLINILNTKYLNEKKNLK